MTLEIQQDRSLASLNTLGLAVRAEHFVRVHSEVETCEALALAREKSWPVTVLGGGSNVVFQGDVGGLVMHLCIPGILFDGAAVEAGAGEAWHQLVLSSLEQGLSGIENLSLIPGSAGAAPIQNIGAYGAELTDVFESLTAIDRHSLETLTLRKDECRFGYRDSIFKHELRDRIVITRIRLALSETFRPNLAYEALRHEIDAAGTEVSAQSVSETVCAIRRRKLPNPDVIGNVGSFFKNPVVSPEGLDALRRMLPAIPCWATEAGTKVSAAWLIEQSGLKGKAVGGAEISPQHALVIVNQHHATGEDVVALADLVRQTVASRYGLWLEVEPVIYASPRSP